MGYSWHLLFLCGNKYLEVIKAGRAAPAHRAGAGRWGNRLRAMVLHPAVQPQSPKLGQMEEPGPAGETHQVEDPVGVPSQLGHLCQGWVFPDEDLVLRVAMRAHLGDRENAVRAWGSPPVTPGRRPPPPDTPTKAQGHQGLPAGCRDHRCQPSAPHPGR